jgi:hypothetical protein
MTLSDIGRLAANAEKACSAVIDHPTDMEARRSLFDVLGPIVNPIFVDHNDLPPYLHGMMRQACTLGEGALRPQRPPRRRNRRPSQGPLATRGRAVSRGIVSTRDGGAN